MFQYIVCLKDGSEDRIQEFYISNKGFENRNANAFIFNESNQVIWFEIYFEGQKQDKLEVFSKMR